MRKDAVLVHCSCKLVLRYDCIIAKYQNPRSRELNRKEVSRPEDVGISSQARRVLDVLKPTQPIEEDSQSKSSLDVVEALAFVLRWKVVLVVILTTEFDRPRLERVTLQTMNKYYATPVQGYWFYLSSFNGLMPRLTYSRIGSKPSGS